MSVLNNLSNGAEKAMFFAVIGIMISSSLGFNQPTLKTSAMIAAGSTSFLYLFNSQEDVLNEGIVATTILAGMHFMHDSIFGHHFE